MSIKARVHRTERKRGSERQCIVLSQPEDDREAGHVSWIIYGETHSVTLAQEPDEPMDRFRRRLDLAAATKALSQLRDGDTAFLIYHHEAHL